eukprot:CCRYP_016686-RC/>CCRYP_016686-RC protein AED:0.38 eAED:0.37 QI:0/1/0/1/1/1/2/0/279
MSQQKSASTPMNRSIPPKPKRPLTVFNLFAILERNYIVQKNQKRAKVPFDAPSDSNADPYAATRPERYRDVVLPSNWFVVGMNRVKRSKHKKHGVISFNDLTKEISLQWKSVDAETRQYCEMIAADELERYRRDMAAHESTFGKDAVKAQKRNHTKKFTKKCVADNSDHVKCDDSHGYSGSQFSETETGLATIMGMAGMPPQTTTQKHCYDGNPFQVQIKRSNPGENNHSPSSNRIRGHHTRTLSDYLPDDQEAALALVGNNYDNILHGEELEKAFDSD